MQPFDHFLLVIGRLGAHSINLCPKSLEFGMMIPEGTILWRAAFGAGNFCPAFRFGCAGLPCHRIAINDQSVLNAGQVDGIVIGHNQRQVGQKPCRADGRKRRRQRG